MVFIRDTSSILVYIAKKEIFVVKRNLSGLTDNKLFQNSVRIRHLGRLASRTQARYKS